MESTGRKKKSFTERLKTMGPAAIVTAAFIGPGTVTTASLAGAGYGYAHQASEPYLFVVVQKYMFTEVMEV